MFLASIFFQHLMIVQFFKKNYTRQIVLFGLISTVLWLPGFWMVSTASPSRFFIPFSDFFYTRFPFFPPLKPFLAFLLVLFESLFLNHLLVRHGLFSKMSFFPALLYMVFLSHDPRLLTFHPLLIANLFFLSALSNLLRSYDTASPYELIFNAGFLITCGGLFYAPFLFFTPLLFICLFVYRLYGWREWILSVLGWFTPWIFVLSYLYLTDSIHSLHQWFAINTQQLQVLSFSPLSVAEKIFGFVFLCFGFLSVSYFLNHTRDKGLAQRKKNTLFSYAVLFSLPAVFYSGNLGFSIVILSPTLTYLYSFFFFGKRKTKRSNLYLTIFFTFVVAYYLFHLVSIAPSQFNTTY